MKSFGEILRDLEEKGNLRKLPSNIQSGNEYLDFSSNDYLGLAKKWKLFMPEFQERFSDYGFSSSASRLLSSRQEIFLRLEDYLLSLYGKPALLFNSGYHANVGVIGALSLLPSTLFVCDKLVHASIIDGLRISGAEFKRFLHNDLNALTRILDKESAIYERIIIVAESIYSMEGDISPIKEIVKLKNNYSNLWLYLDEAHAFGVRGEKGLGIAEEFNVLKEIDFLIGTFGKAAASAGAFVITDTDVKEYLINYSRSFIFSTALPPINVAWSLFMIEKLIDMKPQRERLKEISLEFKKFIESFTDEINPSQSQIIPLITGNSKKALEIASLLKDQFKIIALPIRRPTVPPGKECIRFSLSSSFSQSVIKYLEESLSSIL